MLDDIGPTCLIYCQSPEDTLQYTFLIWYFNDFNQQHSEQNSNTLTVIPFSIYTLSDLGNSSNLIG